MVKTAVDTDPGIQIVVTIRVWSGEVPVSRLDWGPLKDEVAALVDVLHDRVPGSSVEEEPLTTVLRVPAASHP
jgi:hypothetical protein